MHWEAVASCRRFPVSSVTVLGGENDASDRWGSREWLSGVRTWVRGALDGEGLREVGEPVESLTRPWSTVWTVDTDGGRFWFKESCHAWAGEGSVQAVLAELAAEYVDAPVAIEPCRGWMLTGDGGPTVMDASPGGTRGVEVHTLMALLGDYARLQRRTVDQRKAFEQAGLRVVVPGDAIRLARSQAEHMSSLPAGDPRHLTVDQRDIVLGALPALAEAGAALAAGVVPLALDQCDLFPRNVFMPRATGAPYRFFDFAEAVWSHPFGSLVMFVWECLHRWEIETPDDVVDCRDERIRAVFDAYLGCWTDLAPIGDLRVLAQHALRIASLHRSEVWLRVLDDADDAAIQEHGKTPWAWLQDVAKPVLL